MDEDIGVRILRAMIEDVDAARLGITFVAQPSLESPHRLDVRQPDGCGLVIDCPPPGSSLFGWIIALECIQQEVLEVLWGDPWPPCPEHTHPLVPREVEDWIAWCCPRSGQPWFRLGTLGSQDA